MAAGTHHRPPKSGQGATRRPECSGRRRVVGMANYAESPSSGVWATQSAEYTDVQNLKVSIAAQGGPVLLQMVATLSSGDANGNIGCGATAGSAAFSSFRFTRDGTPL